MKKYIAEIAGKDSVAAVIKFMREISGESSGKRNPICGKAKDMQGAERIGGKVSRGNAAVESKVSRDGVVIIPTIVYTGTEYGDKRSYYESIEFLGRKGAEAGIKLADTIELEDGRLWNLLCAKYQYMMNRKYGFYTPCVACHLFTHLMRLPLFKETGAEAIITGERHSHQGKLKANQHTETIKCFSEIFEKNGVKFIKPLLEIEDTKQVDDSIGDETVIARANDVKCVLSGNLQGFELEKNTDKLKFYLEDFLKPAGIFCAEAMLASDGEHESPEACDEWKNELEKMIKEILI